MCDRWPKEHACEYHSVLFGGRCFFVLRYYDTCVPKNKNYSFSYRPENSSPVCLDGTSSGSAFSAGAPSRHPATGMTVAYLPLCPRYSCGLQRRFFTGLPFTRQNAISSFLKYKGTVRRANLRKRTIPPRSLLYIKIRIFSGNSIPVCQHYPAGFHLPDRPDRDLTAKNYPSPYLLLRQLNVFSNRGLCMTFPPGPLRAAF